VNSSIRRLIGAVSTTAALAVTAAVVLPVASAQADLINLDACSLAPWLDSASYELAPGGDFESPSWTLSGRAALVPGSEPFAATGTLGTQSLSLPAGASAESPATCVDAAYPTIRFFTSGVGLVAVSVVYNGVTLPAGVATATGGWSPSLQALTLSAIAALTSDGSAQVSIRLTTLLGDVGVDDVFVDPWNRS
jgi:hypothetical protein